MRSKLRLKALVLDQGIKIMAKFFSMERKDEELTMESLLDKIYGRDFV
jgi:hypothetical protein